MSDLPNWREKLSPDDLDELRQLNVALVLCGIEVELPQIIKRVELGLQTQRWYRNDDHKLKDLMRLYPGRAEEMIRRREEVIARGEKMLATLLHLQRLTLSVYPE